MALTIQLTLALLSIVAAIPGGIMWQASKERPAVRALARKLLLIGSASALGCAFFFLFSERYTLIGGLGRIGIAGFDGYKNGAAAPTLTLELDSSSVSQSTNGRVQSQLMLRLQNLEDLPLFDLQLWATSTNSTVHHGINGNARFVPVLTKGAVYTVTSSGELATQPGKFSVSVHVRTRGGLTAHHWQFFLIENTWQGALRSYDSRTGKLIREQVSALYPRTPEGAVVW